jgi:hypothetical protein
VFLSILFLTFLSGVIFIRNLFKMMKYIAVALPMAATVSDAAIFSRNGQRDPFGASIELLQDNPPPGCTTDLDCLYWDRDMNTDWNTLPIQYCDDDTKTCQQLTSDKVIYIEQSQQCYLALHGRDCATHAGVHGQAFSTLDECLAQYADYVRRVDADGKCQNNYGPVEFRHNYFCPHQLAGIIYNLGTDIATCNMTVYCDGQNQCPDGKTCANHICQEKTTSTSPVPTPAP